MSDKKHGGFRPGAGAPTVIKDGRLATFTIEKSDWDRIKGNRSDFFRAAVKEKLEAPDRESLESQIEGWKGKYLDKVTEEIILKARIDFLSSEVKRLSAEPDAVKE